MNELIEQIYRSGKVVDEHGDEVDPFPTSIRYGMGKAFYDLVTETEATRTLEVGFAYGLAGLFLCQAHRDRGHGSHVAIDPGQENYRSIGLRNIERAGLQEHFRFLPTPSHTALPELVAEGQQFDFAFIDGMHLFDFAFVDFYYVDLMLPVGGCVAVDDLWMPAVRKVVSFFLKNRGYERVRVDTTAELPPLVRLSRIARKLVQNPLDVHDWPMRFDAQGAYILRKTREDDRAWDWHRSF